MTFKQTFAISALVLAASLTAAPYGHADLKGCTAWDLSVQEQEEGRELTASACAKQDTNTILELRCFGPDVGVRYVPAAEFEFGEKDRDIEYVVDSKARPVFVQYEGIDGALGAYVPHDHTVIKMLKAGTSVTIRDPLGVAPEQTFTLKGAGNAIAHLIAKCPN
ncbi:MAG: hypothetical protein AAFV45_07575 [Pseudomonadota bacterium]